MPFGATDRGRSSLGAFGPVCETRWWSRAIPIRAIFCASSTGAPCPSCACPPGREASARRARRDPPLDHRRRPGQLKLGLAGRRRWSAGARRSDCLRHHLDRAARALRDAHAAALAVVVVELEALAGAELDDRVVRADAVAVVALEAVAARQAAARLESALSSSRPPCDLVEASIRRRSMSSTGRTVLRRVGVVPGVELARTSPRSRASARGSIAPPRSHASMWRAAFLPWPTATVTVRSAGTMSPPAKMPGAPGHHVGPDLRPRRP